MVGPDTAQCWDGGEAGWASEEVKSQTYLNVKSAANVLFKIGSFYSWRLVVYFRYKWFSAAAGVAEG